MEQLLIEIPAAYDPEISGTRALYFSTRGYTSLPTDEPPNQYYAPRISQPGNYETSLFEPGKTMGASRVGFGEVRLANPDGALDYLVDFGIDGREILIKTVTALGLVVLLASCSLEQPEFTANEIVLRIKDPQMAFSVPVQPTKYAGDNALPEGLEGTADIKGKPKPLTFGRVYNVAPVLVNGSKLIYQVHESAAKVPSVYDKGVRLSKGDDYADQAAMESTAPQPREYRVCPSRGYFRLGASPVGQVTADVVEGETAADRTAAQVGKRIALRAIPEERIAAEDVAALDVANGAEIGIYIDEETTVMAALDQVLGSVGAWYGFDAGMSLRMEQFTAPSGTPEITLGPDKYLTLERIASNDPGRGIPACKVNLNYAKNYTVQTDLAGGAQAVELAAHWEENDLPAAALWTGAVYGNGRYLALDIESSAAMISLDGISWEQHATNLANHYIAGITYGNGVFVAVSRYASFSVVPANTALVSGDGVTWEQHGFPPASSKTDIAFGAGKFVAVGWDSCAVSADGVTWIAGAIPAGHWTGVAYGNGVFVAIDDSDQSAVSSDGINWQTGTLPVATSWYRVAFGNGVFVATVRNSNTIATSTDGVNWIRVQTPSMAAPTEYQLEDSYSGIVFGGGYFMIPTNGTCTLISPDGVNWIRQYLPSESITYGPDGVLIYDGTAWVTKLVPHGLQAPVICYGDGSFVMVSAGPPEDATSVRYVLHPSVARAAWAAKEYRTVSPSDATVRTKHRLAPEMNVDTLLVDPADAQAEASRLLDLYKIRRDTLQLQVRTSVLPYIELGRVVKIVSPRYGYSAGKPMRVIGTTVDRETGVLTLMLWG